MSTEPAKPDIVVICGPTCVGKTAVAIDLATRLDGEIVGADSMQVYRHMDIGTAKPTHAERQAVPHHMIDIVDPDAPFDAARYAALARRAIDTICSRGRLPFVAGGTGLYIRALTGGIFKRGASDPAVRERLKRTAQTEGIQMLHRRLERCDPASARRLHPKDALRIVRALEVYEITGKPLSDYHRGHRFGDRPYRVLSIGLDMARERLYNRIDRRVEAMLAAGFFEEVRQLLKRGYGEDLKSMQAIGYRHMVDFIKGRIDRDTLAETMKRDTRRYAKRQLTWFRADPQTEWYGVEAIDDMLALIRRFLSHL
jgi:tRNA dimethylallyltransferase